jgi:hypothetical protein
MNDDEQRAQPTAEPSNDIDPEPTSAAPVVEVPVVEAPAALSAPEPQVVWPPRDMEVFTVKRRPVLGPALTVFGVLLWAFVVMGTFTTSWLPGGDAPLGQGVAVVLVAAATVGAWIFTVRRSLAVVAPIARGPVGRFAIVGLVAFALWVAVMILASIVGYASGSNVDMIMATVLLVVAVVAVVKGDAMLHRPSQAKRSAPRFVVLAAWLGAGIVTLASCVELVAEH